MIQSNGRISPKQVDKNCGERREGEALLLFRFLSNPTLTTRSITMLFVQDSEVRYTLADFGEALITTDISTGEVCQVNAKDFSPFENAVFQFLLGQEE